MRILVALLLSCLFSATQSALAEDQVCGPAPTLPTTAQSVDFLKGQLQGQADLLSKLVGKAELNGQVEAVRNSLYQTSDKFFAAQKDAYLAYIFCVIVMRDQTLSTSDKLAAIDKFKAPPTPPPPTPQAPAIATTLTKTYRICVGEYERNCQQHDSYLYCGANLVDWAKPRCGSFRIVSVNTYSGNKCGYGIADVYCDDPH